MAPVKDPFSCPEEFGIDSAFRDCAAVYGYVFLMFSCTEQVYYLRKNSFPEPLSPVTSTERSIGATRMARAMARINACGVADNREPLFCGCDFRRYVLRLKHFYIIKQLSKRIRGAKEHRSVRGDICRVSLHQETPPVFPPISARRSRRARLSLSSGISPWEAAHCADASRSDRGC